MVTHQDIIPRFSNSDPPGSGWYFLLDLFPLDMYGNRQPPQKCEHVRFWGNSMIHQAQMISSSGFQVVHCYFFLFVCCSLMSAARSKKAIQKERNPFFAACFSVCLAYPSQRTGSREQMRDVYVGTQQLLEHWT